MLDGADTPTGIFFFPPSKRNFARIVPTLKGVLKV